jgi:hypothetical protein
LHIAAAGHPLLWNRGEDEPERGLSMNLVWLIVGVGIFGLIATRMARRPERGGQSDLGFVSQRWVAEHRVSHTSDQHR